MIGKKIAFFSCEIPHQIPDFFENKGYVCVFLPSFGNLDTPVAHHPDMLFSTTFDGALLCDEEYLKDNPFILDLGVRLVTSCKKLGKKYPDDILFDALIIGDTVYGKIDSLAPEILKNRHAVSLKQGYTLCSTLVTDKCAVTADEGIYLSLNQNGVDTLKISAGNILLKGYGCGFIGGASCFDKDSDTVVFFGNLSEHPDGEKITVFLEKHGHRVVFFEEFPLSDFGGAKLISK